MRVKPFGSTWSSKRRRDSTPESVHSRPPFVAKVTPRSPIYLAFSASGGALFVGSGTAVGPSSLYRVPLTRGVDGAVIASAAVLVAALPQGISGLALDACDNAYVAQVSPGRLVRVGAGGATTTLVTGVPGLRGGAFGAGAGFDERTLYLVNDDDGIYAVTVGVTGARVTRPP